MVKWPFHRTGSEDEKRARPVNDGFETIFNQDVHLFFLPTTLVKPSSSTSGSAF